MTVNSTVSKFLRAESTVATDVEAAMCKALAKQIDDNGGAAAVKELRQLITEIGNRKPQVDKLDELAKKRAARHAG